MNVPWAFRILLAVITFAVHSKGTVEIENRIRLITPVGDMGGGRVEVYHDGVWGTICDENWSIKAAEVVCKELGYKAIDTSVILATKKAFFGEGKDPIHLSNVQCDGKEHSILECSNDGWGVTGSCTHKDDAGVRCLKDDIPDLINLGCWIDDPDNRILGEMYSSYRGKIDWNNMGITIFKCAKDAINSGKVFRLYGVQYYGECYSEEGNPDYKKMRSAPNACVNGVGPESHNAVYGFGPYYNLGCWEDKPGGGRTMTLLVNYRGKIDWSDMEKIVQNCYKAAKAAGKKLFAVQFYGECRVSDDETSFRKHGQATNCWKGVGAQWSNYVYKIRPE